MTNSEILKGNRGGLETRAKRTSDENRGLAAHGLLAAEMPEETLRDLRLFAITAFPFDLAPLLAMSNSMDRQIARASCRAIANLRSPQLRQLAFRWVEDGHASREWAITMLKNNYIAGDDSIAARWLAEEMDHEIQHRHCFEVVKIWQAHPAEAPEAEMLLKLYEQGPCSMCRQFKIGRLLELGALPSPVREECAFDANNDIRLLVGAA